MCIILGAFVSNIVPTLLWNLIRTLVQVPIANFTEFISPKYWIFYGIQFHLLPIISAAHIAGQEEKILMLTWFRSLVLFDILWFTPLPLSAAFGISPLFFFFFKKFLIVIQLQLSAFSPPPSTPSHLNPPPSHTSTLPLDFVHVSFIVVLENPSPHCPLPTPLWLLLDCS